MSRPDASLLDRFRRSDYVGANRCLPCTVLNLAVAAVLSALLARKSKRAAAVAFALSAAVVSIRGYLVPGTPALTQRYLPESAGRSLGKDPVAERVEPEFVTDAEPADRGVDVEQNGSATPDAVSSVAEESGDDGDDDAEFRTLEKMRRAAENEVDPEAFLLTAGVLEPSDDPAGGFDVRFTDEFADDARDRLPKDVGAEGIDCDRLAPMFEVEPDEMDVEDRDYPAYRVGVRVRKWPSAAAQALDVATFEAIGARSDEWDDVPIQQRLDIVEWLRGVSDACPVCGGDIEFSDDVVESCCGRYTVTTLSCADCDAHLREFDPSKVGDRENLVGLTP